MSAIKPIETRYKGYRFRSRLEARWAVFFDTLGVSWEYEAQGYDLDGLRYLPDFWLPKHDTWVEIKGGQTEGWRDKADALAEASDKAVFIAVGSIGDHQWFAARWYELPQLPIGFDAQVNGLLRMVAPREDDWLDSLPGVQLHCPICGEQYVHFDEPTYKATDNYDAWEGRGSALRIPMWCEGNHQWALRFGFHKGAISLAIENVTAGTDDFGLWLASGDQQRHDAAITAARSARFEHGERP